MSIDLLLNVVPPPLAPIETGNDARWSEVERELSVALPADYKEYVKRYGTGYIGIFLWPWNPFALSPHLNLLEQTDSCLRTVRQLKEEVGEEYCPFPLYPESSGLLPWGHTDNGNMLFWRTVGAPDQWTVVVHEGRGPDFEEFSERMTDFLAKLVIGTLASAIIPAAFLDHKALFQPVR